jgi:ABC-type taurine transport system ATPase subunit
MTALVSLHGIIKRYIRGKQRVQVLHGIDLEMRAGEFLALIVPSGSGKTTLLNLIGGIMAVGAVFGALNAMYSAISTRTVEIATLRVLGFGASAVVVSVFAEALMLTILGGAVGRGIARLDR